MDQMHTLPVVINEVLDPWYAKTLWQVIQQSYYTDWTQPFSVSLSQNNYLKWPVMALYLALLSSSDFTVAIFHLHYYGKQRLVK